MSGRNRGSHVPMKSGSHGGMLPSVHEPPPYARGPVHEPPPYARGPVHEPPPLPRGVGPVPHPALLKEMREAPYSLGPGKLPPHPAIIEEKLAAQHDDILGLLIDNQRLAATHVALRQELEAVQFELHRTQKYAGAFHAEKDLEMRELNGKAMKIEMDLRAADAMRTELRQVNMEIKQLTASRQELTAQVQAMNDDLARMTADFQEVPAIRAQIESLKQELLRARAAIEYEKKGYAENYEHGQLMEKKLVAMERELEKLRIELANAEKGARAVAFGNQAPGYNSSYGNNEAVYAGNPYPAANYGSNPINPSNPAHPVQPGMEGYPQYGPGHGAWGGYEMQRAPGPR